MMPGIEYESDPPVNDTPATPYKTVLRKLLPDFLLKERGIYLRLGPKAGAKYMRLRLLRAVGANASKPEIPKTSRSFLFVCFVLLCSFKFTLRRYFIFFLHILISK